MASPSADISSGFSPATPIFTHLNQSDEALHSSWLLLSEQPFWLLATTSFLGLAIMLSITFAFIMWFVHRPFADLPSFPFISYLRGHTFPDSTQHSVVVLYRKMMATLNDHNCVRFNILCFLPTVATAGHEGMKALIANTDTKTEMYNPIAPWIGGGLIMVNGGSAHFRKRRLLTPAFHFEVLRDYAAVFNRSARTLIDKFKKMSDQSRLPDGSFVEDIYPHMTNFSLDNVMQCVFSKETNCQLTGESVSNANDVTEYLQAVHEMTGNLIHRLTSIFLFFDFIFYLTPTGFRFRRNVRTCRQYSKNAIVARRAAMGSMSEEEVAKGHGRGHLDFLDILLRCRDDKGAPMDEEEMIRECNTFMFAGHDTTASAMTWLLLHLASNQTIQEKCRQEVKALLEENLANNGKEELSYEQLMNKMPYLSACLKETLRLCPSVPYISRRIDKPIVMENGKVIPAGTIGLLAITLIHYDPRVFPEPYIFRPERFIGEEAQQIPPTAYVPFSYGSRNCLGMVFAQLEIKVCLAWLLRAFEFRVSTTHELRYEHAIITRPRDGVHLVFSPIHATDR